MTRLPVSQAAPRIPATVVLGDLAIAAGMAGRSVALCYRDYPAPLLCELWSRHCQSLSGDQVYHVRTAADARKLGPRVGSVRIVLVHDARQHNTVSWIIQLNAPIDGESRPAVFTAATSKNLDDNPGAALVLGCNTDESRAIEDHLLRGERVGVDWSDTHLSQGVEVDERLQAVIRQAATANALDVHRFRNCLILHALLAGACVLRPSRATNSPADNAMINLEDYRLVRGLLRSPVVCSPDELCDSLAIDMINRANIFLKVKYGPDSVVRNPFAAEDYDKFVYGRGGPPRRELVTRKEIADLGNTGSETEKQLLEYLRHQTDGHAVFAKMGLRRRPPNRDEWQAVPIDSLTACLRPWTY